ncbi:hypothetical protein CYMTET_8281 [Cymbomonas tetramitiformis]|uniref:Glycerate dehydrogenase n=1 Tax=Cymbomonas tetramitiformis TaxID=36881 RepID=A0AAE0GTZ5_9CHLO|nr:hypothetical protein CYMTET_8281 [Cymbomonas tetramitiformis]|eukprot:gene3001-3818_t
MSNNNTDAGAKKSKVVVLNCARINFDNQLDFSKLSAVAEVTQYDDSSPSPEEIIRRVSGQDVVITKELALPTELVASFPPSVSIICEAGTGYNNIDIATARVKGIAVCNVPAYSSDAVAHLVITFVLSFSCSLVAQQRMLASGRRDNFTKHLQHPHFELGGKTLGLIGGSGNIGSKVASIALALGLRVIVSSRKQPSEADMQPGVQVTTSVEELLQCSDFVSIHCPLNEATKNLIDAAALRKMKPTAFIINTARGPIINEADLIVALNEGVIAGAGLDVQTVEPPPSESPLYSMESVVLTPHIGWKRLETRQRLIDAVADNIDSFLKGIPVNVVN